MTLKVKCYFYPDGTVDKIWRNEKRQAHREDGPACESSSGARIWRKNGLRHRENGPAVVWENGTNEYYLNGNPYSKEDYWKEIEKIKKEEKEK